MFYASPSCVAKAKAVTAAMKAAGFKGGPGWGFADPEGAAVFAAVMASGSVSAASVKAQFAQAA
jgi:hypothetical protein